MCEHMKLQGFWKFSFWSLFENHYCGACGAKFSVPVGRQWLAFLLSAVVTLALLWCATYLRDIPGWTGRILQAAATAIVIFGVPHSIAYSTYLRAFRRARAKTSKG